MDDLIYGTRNKRGDWKPKEAIEPPPVFVWPPRLLGLLRWLPHYLVPWNALFLGLAMLFWFFLTPPMAMLRTLAPGWILYLLVRNSALVLLAYGALELRLYIRRGQGNQFKYNAKWPVDNHSDVFWFKSQNIDNMIRTFAIGLPIWTAYEAFSLWVFANGWARWVSFAAHPIYLVCFAFLLPMIHEFHFYCVHRFIHWRPLYRAVHSIHHNSVNPSPWSSLSMHPVEHLLYWSGTLLHLVIPSHPLLMLYHLQISGTGAVVGHIGFDRIVLGENTSLDAHTYAHYLHHRYFEVNYADGIMPFDRLFGTWHDGTEAADDRMNARLKLRAQRVAARAKP
jgi:sterol desaturase/sphingolipid hydroxylase (fatty acid hydroxylase superfamily)